MKFILFTLTALLATLLQGCATTVSTASSEEDGRPMITHSVYGMDCPGCHGGLEKNLEKIPGVADAAAARRGRPPARCSPLRPACCRPARRAARAST